MAGKVSFTFKSTDSNVNVHFIKWIPDGEVKGIVQIVHGMTEYMDRYDDIALFLNKHNILVIGHDHLGHGYTANSIEELGYFADWAGNGKLVSDIFRLKVIVKREYPNVPYFLIGHSIGSLLTREYIMRFKDDLDGVILMGIMNYSNIKVFVGITIGKIIALFKGRKYRSTILNTLGVELYNLKFREDGRNSWITSDKEIVKAYNKNPLCTFTYTVGAYLDILEGMKEVNTFENISNINKNLPILLLSGDADPVGDFGKSVKKLYKTYKNMDLNVKIKLYKNCRHELVNELNREQIYNDILRWIYKYM